MTRKNIGWLLIIASFILAGFLLKLAFIGDLLDLIIFGFGVVVVWQENGKSAAQARKAKGLEQPSIKNGRTLHPKKNELRLPKFASS